MNAIVLLCPRPTITEFFVIWQCEIAFRNVSFSMGNENSVAEYATKNDAVNRSQGGRDKTIDFAGRFDRHDVRDRDAPVVSVGHATLIRHWSRVWADLPVDV